MNIQNIEVGKTYNLSGDIENGWFEGKPFISHENVTRKVVRITDTHIICECGRKFIKNDKLEAVKTKFDY